MAHLIIGHVSTSEARIWVRGERSCRDCEVTLTPVDVPRSVQPRPEPKRQTRTLPESGDYCDVIVFSGLMPGAEYHVSARFSPQPGDAGLAAHVEGRLRTVPLSSANAPLCFDFVLSSCNLSVVTINDLMSLILTVGGATVGRRSLDLPLDRWQSSGWSWAWPLVRKAGKLSLGLAGAIILKLTRAKQPPPPFLRSPFLKLSAVFDSTLIDVWCGESDLPAVGDLIELTDGTGNNRGKLHGSGTVACGCAPAPGTYRVIPGRERPWRIVLTHVKGALPTHKLAHRRTPRATADGESRFMGPVVDSMQGQPWFPSPAFFIHAGDQIYYDVPWQERAPLRREYNAAYREAFFDDGPNRHLLAHWPHYMILDDHEIADQFANDFKPPIDSKKTTEDTAPIPVARPEVYLREAVGAYRDYVDARNPQDRAGDHRLDYRFEIGEARFFVLNTRTERVNGPAGDARIIGKEQMAALRTWLVEHKDRLKFVVTSVPFVAQIKERDDRRPRGAEPVARKSEAEEPVTTSLNVDNDKWSAERFQPQRDELIDLIAREGIEQLVFLTGDMHCCYHASMRIGQASKYECVTIHELCAGPVNQLQLGSITDFETRFTSRTLTAKTEYEVTLDQFHGEVNGVMHLSVNYMQPDPFLRQDQPKTPEITWNVIRTLTDDGATAWSGVPSQVDAGAILPDATSPATSRAIPPATAADTPPSEWEPAEPTMAGRITFVRKRTTEELALWP